VASDYAKLFDHMDPKAPKGILLCSPPGTGKTMLSKDFAAKSQANFIKTIASEAGDIRHMIPFPSWLVFPERFPGTSLHELMDCGRFPP